jgi:hypothetical protein
MKIHTQINIEKSTKKSTINIALHINYITKMRMDSIKKQNNNWMGIYQTENNNNLYPHPQIINIAPQSLHDHVRQQHTQPTCHTVHSHRANDSLRVQVDVHQLHRMDDQLTHYHPICSTCPLAMHRISTNKYILRITITTYRLTSHICFCKKVALQCRHVCQYLTGECFVDFEHVNILNRK